MTSYIPIQSLSCSIPVSPFFPCDHGTRSNQYRQVFVGSVGVACFQKVLVLIVLPWYKRGTGRTMFANKGKKKYILGFFVSPNYIVLFGVVWTIKITKRLRFHFDDFVSIFLRISRENITHFKSFFKYCSSVLRIYRKTISFISQVSYFSFCRRTKLR